MALDAKARPARGFAGWIGNPRVRSGLLVCSLLMLTIAAHAPGIRGGFISDDHLYITKNQLMHSGSGLRQIWLKLGATSQYYPLTFSSFWLEYRLWGTRPAGYHAVNVLLHALNALLIYIVLRRLKLPGAWLMAAIFGLHPVNVASVAWVSERKNVLSTAFYLASLLCYMKFLSLGSATKKRPSPVYCAAGLVLFGCALLSKTVTCTLPAAILVLMWWRRRPIDARAVIALAPMFAAAVVMGAVTVYAERNFSGASTDTLVFSASERLLIAGRALWHYAATLLWPARLCMVRPRWRIDPAQWQQYLFPMLAAFALAATWLAKRKIGRGPFAALALFTVTLLPVLGLVSFSYMEHSFVADHLVYLPCIALIALGVSAGMLLMRRLGRAVSRLQLPAAVVLIAVLALMTWNRSKVYADPELLWNDTIAKNPGSFMAYNGRGMCHRAKGRLAQAIADFNKAIELKPNHAPAYHNRGNAYYGMGNRAQALADYSKVIQITRGVTGSRYVASYAARAAACIELGDYDQAIADFTEAIKMAPHVAKYFLGRGTAYAKRGEHLLAIADYDEAVRLKADYSGAYVNRGESYSRLGRYDRAVADFSMAIKLNPDFGAAYYQRARAYKALGRRDLAAQDLAKAAELSARRAGARTATGGVP